MCKRNSPDKNEASMGSVRETPQIKKKGKEEEEEEEASLGCVRETPQIKKEARMGCVRETPQLKIKPARDV